MTDVERTVAGSDAGAAVAINVTVAEDDASLSAMYVSATLDWNDGSELVTTGAAAGEVGINLSKFLLPGFYVITITARNYRAPLHDVVVVKYLITVDSGKLSSNPPRIVYGPILPRDTGSPRVDTWQFDTGSDLLILESWVKMLLLTSKGERIMEPSYGTGLRRILFELDIRAVDTLVHEEIVGAFAAHLPAVKVERIDVARDAHRRDVTVYLALVSRLTQQAFQTNVVFVK